MSVGLAGRRPSPGDEIGGVKEDAMGEGPATGGVKEEDGIGACGSEVAAVEEEAGVEAVVGGVEGGGGGEVALVVGGAWVGA